ncbi:MAG: cobyric acid synthase, partial [Desulfovibrionaceae bacterium]|nr:cobyric acid synthase [Desulfovibrionaceae bacterium]
MKASLFSSLPGVFGPNLPEYRHAHGGNLRRLAELAGCRPGEIVDFSASVNPIGPPPWLGQEVGRAVGLVASYPDPESLDLTLAACERYKVWPGQVLAGNGASELLWAAARLAGPAQAVMPVPAYVDYARSCDLAGLPVRDLALAPEEGFGLRVERLAPLLDRPSLVLACQPNNPTGLAFDSQALRDLARSRPDCLFVVDESFADFAPGLDRLVRERPDNVLVILSMTKFFAIPGLRLGLAFAAPDLAAGLKKRLAAWSVNAVAQKVGERCLKDLEYAEKTVRETARLRAGLAAELSEVPGIRVFPSQANFLLCQISRVGLSGRELFERLLADRLAIRLCGNFKGLDESDFRVAVRNDEDNARLVGAMRRVAGVDRPRPAPPARRARALMIQGTGSGAGKSVLVAALCRVFLQDGLSVAPFKAQNMSLNSFVGRDGGEIGRAQATQAAACRLDPEARMNPVLLKPNSETGAQVVVMGRPVGNMSVNQYVRFKAEAFETVKRAYDSLSRDHEVIVLEGAGSPAEINLREHDIVNMAMAEHAGAGVLLAGDIDRGGVFAALVGTMSLLTVKERERVAGFVINKFRGDPGLLDRGLSYVFEQTGRPVLGVVPYIRSLGLPEEDSLSFRQRYAPRVGDGSAAASPDIAGRVDIACVALPHLANFNDLDPLEAEPDVGLRLVDSALDLGLPDAVIIPGSKNTVADMRLLRGAGMAAAIRSLPESVRVVGICAGFQML